MTISRTSILALTRHAALCSAALLALQACGESTPDDTTEPTTPSSQTPDNNDPNVEGEDYLPPLSDLESVVGDHPEERGEELPDLQAKFDLPIPAQYDTPLQWVQPAKSQGSRGVCSIFASVGLMEHLYLKAGATNPDFSEQYLQWAVKAQYGAFPETSGSSAQANIDTIVEYGVPEESIWPYNPTPFDASRGCEKDTKEMRCFTQEDDMPETARTAPLFKLPKREYVSSRIKSIQTYMLKNESCVNAGGTFFYQAWGHGGSKLGVNQANKRAGAIVFPSQEDIADSNERPAGHAFMLCGWDENKTFPRVDENGDPMLDENGNPIVDKGFFIFRNSWGSNWAPDSGLSVPGMGWISMRYIERYGRIVGAQVPDVIEPDSPIVEICGDMLDNDDNGLMDCADMACASDMACISQGGGEVETYSAMPNLSIPDDNEMGASDALTVSLDGEVTALEVSVQITHSFTGDLEIALIAPSGARYMLHESGTEAESSIDRTYTVGEAVGEQASGEWTLHAVDTAQIDVGTVDSWSLTVSN